MRPRTSRDALEFISCDHLLLACSLPLRVVFSMRFTQRKVNFHILDWEMSLCLWPVPRWRGCCKLNFRLWWTLSPHLCLIFTSERTRPDGTCLWSQFSRKTSSQKERWNDVSGDHLPRVWEALGSNLSTPKQGKQHQQQWKHKRKKKKDLFSLYFWEYHPQVESICWSCSLLLAVQFQSILHPLLAFLTPSLTCSCTYT